MLRYYHTTSTRVSTDDLLPFFSIWDCMCSSGVYTLSFYLWMVPEENADILLFFSIWLHFLIWRVVWLKKKAGCHVFLKMWHFDCFFNLTTLKIKNAVNLTLYSIWKCSQIEKTVQMSRFQKNVTFGLFFQWDYSPNKEMQSNWTKKQNIRFSSGTIPK